MRSRLDTSHAVHDPANPLAALSSEPLPADPTEALAIAEHAYSRGWTDGLPVMPCTESRLEEFLAQTPSAPDDVVLEMPHVNRACTVRAAAVNAAMAGCLPEYFPVVLAAWKSFEASGAGSNARWQSTTGSAPFLVVNGPVVQRLGINSEGNIFGSGFRANATIGRAIRLAVLNVFQLKPQLLDQATQASPAKYTCCIAENEQQSPWQPYHVDHGFHEGDSTVAASYIRGTLFIEARHTAHPEALALDIADSAARTGRIIGAGGTAWLILSPEHARVFAHAGWTKRDIQDALFAHSSRSFADLDRVGKGAVSTRTGWRVPTDHPDAAPQTGSGDVNVFVAPEAIEIVVAGADNAGVSTVVETMGSRRPSLARIETN